MSYMHAVDMQGIQMAKDKWIEAMRAARALVKNTQQALACCAEKLKLDMSLEPAESAMRRKQEAALQQLQQLRDETMADLAAGLTAQFLPRCNMSVAEVRGMCTVLDFSSVQLRKLQCCWWWCAEAVGWAVTQPRMLASSAEIAAVSSKNWLGLLLQTSQHA